MTAPWGREFSANHLETPSERRPTEPGDRLFSGDCRQESAAALLQFLDDLPHIAFQRIEVPSRVDPANTVINVLTGPDFV